MPNFVKKNKFEEFVDESENFYKEETWGDIYISFKGIYLPKNAVIE